MALTATRRRTRSLARRTAAPRRVEVLAREAGLHPELVRARARRARPAARARAAFRATRRRASRARARLRRDLGLNYAGAVLACELLARIDELEARLRRYETATDAEVTTWTRTS